MFDTVSFSTAESGLLVPAQPGSPHESVKWSVLWRSESYPGQDIDEYRAKYGKADGEREFFDRFRPQEFREVRDNLLLYGGASLLWECLIGNGTATSAQATTYINNTQGYLGVGDSTTTEAITQTDLQAASNKTRQVMDATYPLHTDGTAGKTITGATNASPISITSATHGYSTGDIIHVTGVGGNTAANGLFALTNTGTNTFTLDGSTGNGSYTSGGLASKFNVLVLQATFGAASANWAWNEWGIFNASTGGKMVNRKVSSLGTKTSGTMSLKAAISLA